MHVMQLAPRPRARAGRHCGGRSRYAAFSARVFLWSLDASRAWHVRTGAVRGGVTARPMERTGRVEKIRCLDSRCSKRVNRPDEDAMARLACLCELTSALYSCTG
ncbi:hypothetical protein GUJ93_ZPchr0003g17122 [Zizania palustris]|uniref:Uncharacterized protein n=1 Tax=Zizania palustris TaxID=103762 RepID=A0A8J5SN78_ZIZPA|nr:hypothetical protein GUJ93_ZPchr0003g17122 [Zizania palustris]